MSSDPSGLGRPSVDPDRPDFLAPGIPPAPASSPGPGEPGPAPAYGPPAPPEASDPPAPWAPHYPPYRPAGSAPPRRPMSGRLKTGLVLLGVIVALSAVLRVAAMVTGRPEPTPPRPVPVRTAPTSAPLTPITLPSLAPIPSLAPTTAWPTPNPRQARPGWQVVTSTREEVSYEVPATADWEPRPGLLVGYEANKQVLVIANTVSRYRFGTCEVLNDDRGYVGLQRSTEALGSSEAAAIVLATRWAQARDTEEDGTVHDVMPPTPRTIRGVNGGDIAVASVTFTPRVTMTTSACEAPAMRFTAAVLTQNGRHYPMVIVSDQGVPDALPLEVEDEIIATLMPAD